jgi:hypothetical protein
VTKKDYVLLTSIVYAHQQHMTWAKAEEAMQHTCAVLAKDNPKFDEAKFRKECALPSTFIRKTLRAG